MPVDGDPIENSAVAVSGNVITDVDRFDEVRRRETGEVLDLGEQALLPGLINAHCHLDYTLLRGKIPPGGSFADWIQAINAEKAKLTGQDYITSINAGFAEALRFGTTTIANLTAFPELVPVIKAPIRTWWLGELIDVRNPDGRQWPLARPPKSTEHWVRHACSPRPPTFIRAAKRSPAAKTPLTTHSPNREMQMFRDAPPGLISKASTSND